MPFDPLTWLLGYGMSRGSNKILDAFAKTGLSSRLLNDFEDWAKGLPSDKYVAAAALFPNLPTQTDPAQHPARAQLSRDFSDRRVPTKEIWLDALVEQWHEVKHSIPEPQPFFNLPEDEARRLLEDLARRLATRCEQDENMFRSTVLEALRSRPPESNTQAQPKPEVVDAGQSALANVYVDVSVAGLDSSKWTRGEDKVLTYSVLRSNDQIVIQRTLGFLSAFEAGGLIAPLSYVTQTACPFLWDFPTLDLKVLNNSDETIYLTEVVFEVEESRLDSTPLFTIKHDFYRMNAGVLVLVNEGGSDIVDLAISFRLLPGNITTVQDAEPPYPHTVTVPRLDDETPIDVTDAFQAEGTNIEGLIELCNGEWDSQNSCVVVKTHDGSEVRLSEEEYDERWKEYLGPFQEEVGTLVGEMSFGALDNERHRQVRFQAPVYLANKRLLGVPKPPTYAYDASFETSQSDYERRVQISHEIKPGDTDRFTVKVGIGRSSRHRFRAVVCDITGRVVRSPLIEMTCFVPRSRSKRVESVMTQRREESGTP